MKKLDFIGFHMIRHAYGYRHIIPLPYHTPRAHDHVCDDDANTIIHPY
jgi:hypothetical protein